MSDLFSPMQLPKRPVLQTADIAEREAANKQREIDTRMRERMATASLQTRADLAEIKEETQKALQTIEQDYRKKAMQQSSRSFASSSGARARSSYQSVQRSNQPSLYNQEAVRLSFQKVRQDLEGRIGVNPLLRDAEENEWGIAEFADGLQGLWEGIASRAVYSQHPDVATATRNAQISLNNIMLDHSERGIIALDKKATALRGYNMAHEKYQLADIAGDEFVDHIAGDNPLGILKPIDQDEGWQILQPSLLDLGRITGEHINDRNSDMWHKTRNLIMRRMHSRTDQEVRGRLINDLSLPTYERKTASQHLADVETQLSSSPFWDSVAPEDKWDIELGDLHAGNVSRLSTIIEEETVALEEKNDAFTIEYAAGGFRDTAPRALSMILIHELGWTASKAHTFVTRHAKNIGDQPFLLGGSATEVAFAAEQAEDQNRRISLLRKQLTNHPEMMAGERQIRMTLARLESIGDLPTGATESLMGKYFNTANASLLAMYAGVRDRFDDFVDILATDKGTNTWGTGLFPTMKDNQDGMSLSSLENVLNEELDEMVLNPAGGERLDQNGMDEFFRRRVLSLAGTMKLTRRTRSRLSGITMIPGGEAQPLTAWRLSGVQDADQAFGGSIMESGDFDLDAIDRYQALSPEMRPVEAVNSIRLGGYTGDPVQDSDKHSQMQSTLLSLRQTGQIHSFRLDPEEREAHIRLSPLGPVYHRDLDAGGIVEKTEEIRTKSRDMTDIVFEQENIVRNTGAGLTAIVDHPETGQPMELSTAAVTTPTNGALALLKPLVSLAEKVATLGADKIDEQLTYEGFQTNWYAQGAMAGLAPWQME